MTTERMTRCIDHDWVPSRPATHPLDARFFVCERPGCNARAHAAVCVDEDGKAECVCGLDDRRDFERKMP